MRHDEPSLVEDSFVKNTSTRPVLGQDHLVIQEVSRLQQVTILNVSVQTSTVFLQIGNNTKLKRYIQTQLLYVHVYCKNRSLAGLKLSLIAEGELEK